MSLGSRENLHTSFSFKVIMKTMNNTGMMLSIVAVGIVAVIAVIFWLVASPDTIPQVQLNNTATTSTSTENENTDTGEGDTQMVEIALIALEDDGASGKQIGCGDSVVLVDQEIQKTQAPLRAALLQLLSIKDTSYGESGLYTALAQADLSLDEVGIENGEAVIKLSGDLSLGGVCDNPRVQAQLVETALQFPTVNKVSIFLNDEPLEEALSMQ